MGAHLWWATFGSVCSYAFHLLFEYKSPLVIINTVCLLRFDNSSEEPPNKPSNSFRSHLKAQVRVASTFFEETKEGKSEGGRWSGGRLHVEDATTYMLQGDEEQISAFKEFVPGRCMPDLCLSSLSCPILEHLNTLQQKVVKNVYANAGYIRAHAGC